MISMVSIKSIEKNLHNLLQKKFAHLLLSLCSGLLLIFAFPRFEQGYIAWLALIPLLWVLLQVSPGQAFWSGFVFGLPLNIYVNMYLAIVLYPYLGNLLATAAMVALFIYISLFYAVFALGANLAARLKRPFFTALAIPSLWLMVEYVRSLGLLGYNVGYIGYTQWGYPYLLNIVSVYGYWGLSFLILFFQTLLVLYLSGKLRNRNLYFATAIFAGLFTAGLILPVFQPVEKMEQPIITGLIQGNTHPEEIVDYSKAEVLERYLSLTEEAIEKETSLDLVAWPETVVHLDFRDEKQHPPEMKALAEKHELKIIYGARVKTGEHLYNSITLLGESGEDFPLYNKHRLVPFVEYFPAEELLNRILQLDLLLGSYTPGEEIKVFDINGIPVAGVVCFESYFGDHMRLFADKGARHQFIVTNDAWFGESIGLEQHAQAAAIRAAESGTGVTQVANSGITISFDYQGRELFRSGKNEQAIFTVPLDMATRNTVYSRYGDFFPVIWAAFLVIACPALYVKTRQENFSRSPRESRHRPNR